MDKFNKCFFAEYFGDYSLRLCNHPSNRNRKTDFNCKNCKLFETEIHHRIKELREELKNKKVELKKLLEEEKRLGKN